MSFWGGGKVVPDLECRPGVGEQIGISHVPLRPVVLQHLCSNAGLGGLDHAEEHCPRQLTKAVEWDHFCPQVPIVVQNGHQMAWAMSCGLFILYSIYEAFTVTSDLCRHLPLCYTSLLY